MFFFIVLAPDVEFTLRSNLRSSRAGGHSRNQEHAKHEIHIIIISLSDHYNMTYTIYSKNSHKICLHKESMFGYYKRFNIDSFTNALSQKLIYKRDYLKRKAIKYTNEETWLLYRRARNDVTEMIKCSTRQYYENSIQESRHNPTKMWKVLKQLTHGNTRESPPNTLTADTVNS